MDTSVLAHVTMVLFIFLIKCLLSQMFHHSKLTELMKIILKSHR